MTNPFADPAAVTVWLQDAARRSSQTSPITQAMLDRAAIVEGSRVLDVGTGAGETALLAAARVGPRGHVLATDPSAGMVEAARAAVEAAGAANVEVRQAGGGEVDASGFDAVIGRNSFQFIPDPESAFARLRASLRPGGRVAAIVWGPTRDDPWMGLPFLGLDAAGSQVGEGDPGLIPGSLGDPERFRSLLEGAGFGDVLVETQQVVRSFPSLEEAWAAIQAAPIFHLVLGRLEAEQRAVALSAIRARMESGHRGGAFEVSSPALLASGTA